MSRPTCAGAAPRGGQSEPLSAPRGGDSSRTAGSSTLALRVYPGLAPPLAGPAPQAGGGRLRPRARILHPPSPGHVLPRRPRPRITAIAIPTSWSSSPAFMPTPGPGRIQHPGHRRSGLAYIARTRRQQDHSAKVYFTDTEVDYRDDNRHLWRYIEQGDEEETFDGAPASSRPRRSRACRRATTPSGTIRARPTARTGSASTRACTPRATRPHRRAARQAPALAKRLKQILDLLKPQH